MRLFRKNLEPGSEVGRPVFTSDNHHIGDIKELNDGGLLIDSPMGRDYWLSERDVQSSTEERVVLIFTKDELDEYKREERPPASVPEGIPTSTRAGLMNDDEQMQIRQRMEQELAEQHRKLSDN